jgi:hypothetical protein
MLLETQLFLVGPTSHRLCRVALLASFGFILEKEKALQGDIQDWHDSDKGATKDPL